ncbi:FtsK/SpoIIIE domain-containing protein [Arsenicicoccus dermatophilus]|uniref:FtsK/SpoIIIE domain-containing protein n=1 Tax=Arsenicicoccus dermatophilus TaxID=1076331 RepID=UPI0039171617
MVRVELEVVTPTGGSVVTLVAPAGTTWAELRPHLCERLGLDDAAVWRVAGLPLPDDAVLGRAPLLRGAHLEPGAAPPPAAPRGHRLLLCAVGGPVAGLVLALPYGDHVVGRDHGCDLVVPDPALSRHHAVLAVREDGVRLLDVGSTNGSRVDGVTATGSTPVAPGVRFRLGDSTLVVTRPPRPGRVQADGEGHLVVHPGPTPAATPREVTVELPRPPAPPDPPTFPWVTLLLPLVGAVVLAAVVRAPYLLVLGLLGPLVVLATHLTESRRRRLRETAERARHEEATRACERQVAEALAAEAELREGRTADPARALLAVTARGAGLWRDPAPGAWLVRLGRAPQPSRVTVRAGDRPPTTPVLDDAPLEVDLRAAGCTAIAGPGAHDVLAAALGGGMTRWGGPAQVHLVAPTARAARRWEWVRWLPGGSPPVPADETAALVASLEADPDDDHLVVVVQAEHPACVALLDRLGSGVVLAATEEADRLPGTARAWLTLDGRGRGGAGLPDGTLVPAVVPDRAAAGWTQALAAALAPLATGSGPSRRQAPPDRLPLSEALGLVVHDPDAVSARWSSPRRGPATVIGHDGAAPVVLDLVADGPHVLVGGTTGSGKSELLQTLVVGLATTLSPQELTFLLVDYKGGAAFDRCADLPHTSGLLTDLDEHLADRALVSLRAELTRRERLLRDAGAADLDAYLARHRSHDEPLPRLVVVVDEFRLLAQEVPGFVDGLLAVATVGRSLGVHLVLATQRPAGVVTPDIRANVNARIALRMRDAADSQDVLEAPDAARLGDRHPGRAWWRTGGGPPRLLQVAWAGAPAVAPGTSRIEVHVAGGPTPPPGGGRTELDVLVDTVTAAAQGRPAVRPPWLPPLPDVVGPDELPCGAVGLADLPHEQQQVPHLLDLAGGRHLAVVGTHRTGRTTALRAVAAAALAGSEVHLHAVDGGGQLGDLARIPRCGTVVGPEDPLQVLRLLQLLAAGCRETPARRTLLLVDRWDAVGGAVDPVLAATLQDALVALLRDGPGGGLLVAMAGDRSLLTSSLATHLGDRLLLRMPDPTDLALAGVPGAARPHHQPPGRALRTPDHVEVQLAQVTAEDLQRVGARAGAPSGPVLRLRSLPTDVSLDALAATRPGAQGGPTVPGGAATFALGGDTAQAVPTPLATAPVVAVLGPPGSGRSTTLAALGAAALVDVAGRAAPPGAAAAHRAAVARATPTPSGPPPVVIVATRRSPLTTWAAAHGLPVHGRDDADALVQALHAPGTVLLVDDAELLLDSPAEAVCVAAAQRATRHEPGAPTVAVAGSGSQLTATFRGLAAELRRCGTGIVLQPHHPTDGELIGTRVPRLHAPPPGRAILVDHGRCLAIQVARPSSR